MEFKALGLLVLFSFALADLQHSYEDAQKTLADGTTEALGRLNATLASGHPVDQDEAVLRLGHVHRVYEAGSEDLELIKNSTGPGNKTEVQSYEDAQKALADGRNEALGRLNATLASGNLVYQDEAVFLAGHLQRVYEAGREDLELIKNFTGPGNKTEALASSVRFWKEKMNDASKPISQNPLLRLTRNMGSSREIPPDPEWNGSEALRLKAAEIDEKVRQTIESFRSEGMRRITANPLQLQEITKWSNSKLTMELVLDSFAVSIRARGQDAKQELAKRVAEKGEQELNSTATATAIDSIGRGLAFVKISFQAMLRILLNK